MIIKNNDTKALVCAEWRYYHGLINNWNIIIANTDFFAIIRRSRSFFMVAMLDVDNKVCEVVEAVAHKGFVLRRLDSLSSQLEIGSFNYKSTALTTEIGLGKLHGRRFCMSHCENL
jgi:hypothetical protein